MKRAREAHVPPRRAWLLLPLLVVGCFETTPAVDAGGVDAGPPPPPPNDLDVLIQMDDSNSVTEEQANLVAELPWFVEAVMTGDLDEDGIPDVEPFDSIQIGIVTGDMGTNGFTVPTCDRPRGTDGVLVTSARFDIMGCRGEYPPFLAYRPGGGESSEEYARQVGCVATVGTGGCGFEQPLEATLKALTPSVAVPGTAPDFEPVRFFENTSGHGDGANAEFLRPESTLTIVLMADEDDCSSADPELYNIDSEVYTDDLNLRCHLHREALHPISRYVDGLIQLRPFPNQVVFFPIVGIPRDLATVAGEPTAWEPLVSDDPDVRDDRVELRIDPRMPTRIEPSCNERNVGLAFAPDRILRTAAGLERAGATAGVGSVCTDDQRPAFEALVRLLRP